jgi:hypothetical protein
MFPERWASRALSAAVDEARATSIQAALFFQATAFSELLYPETTALKWSFPQGNATLHSSE